MDGGNGMRFCLLVAVLVSVAPVLQAIHIKYLEDTFGPRVKFVNVDAPLPTSPEVGAVGGAGSGLGDEVAASIGEDVPTVYFGSNRDTVLAHCSEPNTIGIIEVSEGSYSSKISIFVQGKGFLQNFGEVRREVDYIFAPEEKRASVVGVELEKIIQKCFLIPDEALMEVMLVHVLSQKLRAIGENCIAVYKACTISASTLPCKKKIVAKGIEQQQIKVFYGFDEDEVKAAIKACEKLRFPKIGIVIQRLTDDEKTRECWAPPFLPADVFWNIVNPEETGFIPLGARTGAFRLIHRSGSFDDVGFLVLRPATLREKDWLGSEDFTYVAINDSSNYENIISAQRLFTRKNSLIDTIQVIYGWKR